MTARKAGTERSGTTGGSVIDGRQTEGVSVRGRRDGRAERDAGGTPGSRGGRARLRGDARRGTLAETGRYELSGSALRGTA